MVWNDCVWDLGASFNTTDIHCVDYIKTGGSRGDVLVVGIFTFIRGWWSERILLYNCVHTTVPGLLIKDGGCETVFITSRIFITFRIQVFVATEAKW